MLVADFPVVEVGLSWSLVPRRLHLEGGRVRALGSLDEVRHAVGVTGFAGGKSDAPGTEVEGDGLDFGWKDPGAGVEVAARGVAIVRRPAEVRIRVDRASLQRGGVSFEVRGLDCELSADHKIRALGVAETSVEWSAARAGADAKDANGGSALVAAQPSADAERGPSHELFLLPDPHRLHERAASLGRELAEHIGESASVGIEALTWRLPGDQGRVAFTVGPGPLRLRRVGQVVEVRFSADPRGDASSLSVRALLPAQGGDASVTLEGGPVALSQLGLQEGAAGLQDVRHATVGGKVAVRLADDGSALTFDMDATARGLAIKQRRLAREAVRGIDVELRARGAVDDQGALRLDDVAATMGVIHVIGGGVMSQTDHLAASLHLDLPSTPCQSLLESVPTALLPALQGTRWTGTFGARTRFAFDTRSLDALDLGYDIQDACRATAVPEDLARARFRQAFSHRVYLPDGSQTEQTTGPGTPDWTPIDQISPYLQVAVLTTEDGAFPRHHGFNHEAIRASLIANLKARRFVRGASTITMQLAKNLFLDREKTLSRKLQEVVLTDYLEQVFSKDELMELYLNVVEFGPSVYGVTAASEYYFGRAPAELNLAECLFLSSLLPAPLRLGGMRDAEVAPDGWMRTLHNLMRIARKRNLISQPELEEGLAEPVAFWHGGPRPLPRPPVHVRLVPGPDVDGTPIDEPTDDSP